MQIVTTNDNAGYTEGWTAMAKRIAQRPTDAKKMLTYFAANPPQDSFDLGVMDAAQAAFGH